MAHRSRGVVHVVHDDARHFLATTDEKFDVITSDPINSWIHGTAALYSTEYFDLCKQHLNPGGVVVQWIPLYEKDLATAKCELGTFLDAFPDATLWTSWRTSDGPDQRHDAEPLALRGLDERRAGIGDRRAAGFGEQPERAAFAQGLERVLLLADLGKLQLADRHAERAEEGARGLRVLDREMPQRADDVQRRCRQRIARRAAQGRRNRVEDQRTGCPARASISASAISGRPMREVGSPVSMRSTSAMPRPSIFALPAQS